MAWRSARTALPGDGLGDVTIRLWDLVTGKKSANCGHEYYVHTVSFSQGGTRLATGSGDTTLRIWDTIPPTARPQPPDGTFQPPGPDNKPPEAGPVRRSPAVKPAG